MIPILFYILACTAAPDGGGIYHYRMDAGGQPQQLAFTPLDSPNWMIFAPDGRHAYATCELPGGASGVAAFSVDGAGALHELNRVSSQGQSACHLCLSPDQKRLFCANYSSGSVAVFTVRPDGALAPDVQLLQHHGHGADPQRQEAPHPHFTGCSPDAKYLIVNDLGLDAIYAYPLETLGAPKLSPVLPPGEGPRHLVFTPDGRQAYLITEMGNRVHLLDYTDGRFTERAAYPALAPGFQGSSWAAAVRLAPDARFLYVSNRGEDDIAVFERRPDGTLQVQDHVSAGGAFPRDFTLLDGGRLAAAADEHGDCVQFYQCRDGRLAPLSRLALPHPLAIVAAP